jgi:hypothetical protein
LVDNRSSIREAFTLDRFLKSITQEELADTNYTTCRFLGQRDSTAFNGFQVSEISEMTSRWLGSASIKTLILETLAMVNECKSFGERERERERENTESYKSFSFRFTLGHYSMNALP